MSQTVKRDIPGIDVIKLLMAFAVMSAHFTMLFVSEVNKIPVFAFWTMRCSVPFFFITTGYLTFRIIGQKSAMSHRGLHFLKIWALWTIIYLPTQSLSGLDSCNIIKSFVHNLLFIGELGFSWQMWFVYATALFFIVESYVSDKPLLRRFVRFLYVVGFVSYSYNMYHQDSFQRIGIFIPERVLYGSLIILLGYYMRILIEKVSGKLYMLLLGLLVLSIVLFMNDLPFWDTAGGAAFFMLALSLRSKPDKIYLVMRHESMWIYYIHMYILYFMFMYRSELGLNLAQGFAVALALTFILAWLLTLLQKRSKAVNFLVS